MIARGLKGCRVVRHHVQGSADHTYRFQSMVLVIQVVNYVYDLRSFELYALNHLTCRLVIINPTHSLNLLLKITLIGIKIDSLAQFENFKTLFHLKYPSLFRIHFFVLPCTVCPFGRNANVVWPM